MELSKRGEIAVNAKWQTWLPSALAAGNATTVPNQQIVNAADDQREGCTQRLQLLRSTVGLAPDPRACRSLGGRISHRRQPLSSRRHLIVMLKASQYRNSKMREPPAKAFKLRRARFVPIVPTRSASNRFLRSVVPNFIFDPRTAALCWRWVAITVARESIQGPLSALAFTGNSDWRPGCLYLSRGHSFLRRALSARFAGGRLTVPPYGSPWLRRWPCERVG